MCIIYDFNACWSFKFNKSEISELTPVQKYLSKYRECAGRQTSVTSQSLETCISMESAYVSQCDRFCHSSNSHICTNYYDSLQTEGAGYSENSWHRNLKTRHHFNHARNDPHWLNEAECWFNNFCFFVIVFQQKLNMVPIGDWQDMRLSTQFQDYAHLLLPFGIRTSYFLSSCNMDICWSAFYQVH